MYQVFAFVDGQFKAPLENFISSGTSNIASWVTGPLTAALTLYVILYGFLILRGSIHEPIMDFAFRAENARPAGAAGRPRRSLRR